MNNLDVLWTTDPGWVALGILMAAVIFLIVAHMTKYNVAFVVLDIVVWIAAILTIGAVLGLWDLPSVLDWFNIPPSIPGDLTPPPT